MKSLQTPRGKYLKYSCRDRNRNRHNMIKASSWLALQLVLTGRNYSAT